MADNQGRLRHGIVAQPASIRRKRSRSLHVSVDSSLVDVEASTYRAHAFPPSSSRRRQMSPYHALEAPPVQVKASPYSVLIFMEMYLRFNLC